LLWSAFVPVAIQLTQAFGIQPFRITASCRAVVHDVGRGLLSQEGNQTSSCPRLE